MSLGVQRRRAKHSYQRTYKWQTGGKTCTPSYLENCNSRTMRATKRLSGTNKDTWSELFWNVKVNFLINKYEELLTSLSVLGWKVQSYCLEPPSHHLRLPVVMKLYSKNMTFIYIHLGPALGLYFYPQSSCRPSHYSFTQSAAPTYGTLTQIRISFFMRCCVHFWFGMCLEN